jgi:hypothetical protein
VTVAGCSETVPLALSWPPLRAHRLWLLLNQRKSALRDALLELRIVLRHAHELALRKYRDIAMMKVAARFGAPPATARPAQHRAARLAPRAAGTNNEIPPVPGPSSGENTVFYGGKTFTESEVPHTMLLHHL